MGFCWKEEVAHPLHGDERTEGFGDTGYRATELKTSLKGGVGEGASRAEAQMVA